MPQMAPISWLILFFIFSMTFILFCSTNYYNYMPSSPKSMKSNNIDSNSMTWKW